MKKDITNLKGIGKILLIQLGDIGDVVWMQPTIRAFKECLPESKLYLMTREGFGEFLRDERFLAGIFEIKKYRGGFFSRIMSQLRFLKELRDPGFDLAIDLRSGDRGAFMARLSGATRRVSLHYEDVPFWRKYFFTDIITPAPAPVRARGAAEQTLGIVRQLGIDTIDHIPKLPVSEATIEKARGIIRNKGLDDRTPWITINPFSRWSYKEWLQDGWIEVIEWLGREFQLPVAVVGSPDERGKAEKLIGSCPEKVYNLTGKTRLGELAGVLKLSRLHVGVDSAAPHIAAAVGTPTVTIYGPSSWEDWAPIGKNHRVIAPDKDFACAPCREKGCKGSERSKCLDELKPEKVKAAIREILEKEYRTETAEKKRGIS
jgi:heptosyltransferase-3